MCVLSGMCLLLGMNDVGRKALVPSRGLCFPWWLHHFNSVGIQIHWKEPGSTLFLPQSLLLPFWHLHLFLIIFLFSLVPKKGLDWKPPGKTRPHHCEFSPPSETRNGWSDTPWCGWLSWCEVSADGEQAYSVPLRSLVCSTWISWSCQTYILQDIRPVTWNAMPEN